MPQDAPADKKTLAAFIVMVLTAGGNVVAVRYLSHGGELDSLWAAVMRFAIASALFFVVAALLRVPMPRGRALGGAVLYGALAIGGFFGFVYYGLQDAPAAVAGVFLATVPLQTFGFALAHRQERFRWDSLAGSLLVVAGTVVIVRRGLDDGIPLGSLAAVLAAAACAAEASIVVKAFPPVHPAAMNAIGTAVGTVMLLAAMPVAGHSFAIPAKGSTWAAQAYLVLLGTLAVFGLYLYVLRRWTASAVSYEFVVIPLVGVLLSWWLLDERITSSFVIGGALVLVGVYFGAIRPRTHAA